MTFLIFKMGVPNHISEADAIESAVSEYRRACENGGYTVGTPIASVITTEAHQANGEHFIKVVAREAS